MVITEKKENSSLSTSRHENSHRMSIQSPLHKDGPDTDKNDNQPCCRSNHTQDNRNMNTLDNNCIRNKMAHMRLSGQTTGPRRMQKFTAKFSHLENLITPIAPSPRLAKNSLFLPRDMDDDGDVFHPPPTPNDVHAPSTNFQTVDREKKQEVLAGRLYMVRQIGNASQTSGSPSSPSRAFTRPFSFSSIGLSSPTSSPPSPQSPNAKRKLPVYVRVYRCHKDHFALISRDSSYCSKHIYLNMKHCRVMPGDPLGRFIVVGNSDSGSMMEFETPDLGCREKWLDALQSHTPPESPIRCPNVNGGGGGMGGKGVNGSCSSPSIPKSPNLPTLTEDEEEEDRMS